MKTKIILFIFLFIIVFKIFSQAYIPFIKEHKMWTKLMKSSIDTTNKSIVSYRIEGDTLIGIKQYKKVLCSTSYSNCCIYEDTSLKRVYCIESPYTSKPEFLLYDFNLQVGDTFYDYPYPPCEIIVLSRTTEYFAGKNRIKLVFKHFAGPMVWYEGIGSIKQGIFSPKCLVGSLNYLLCYFENDTLLYHNSTLSDTCFTENNVQYLQIDKLFNSYYSNEILYIKPANELLYTITIFNIFGRKVNEVITYGSLELNVSVLPKGIYLYKIESSIININYSKVFLIN